MAAFHDQPPGQEKGARTGVVVVAAGSSGRMGGIDKIFAPVLGAPLVTHALDALEAFPPVAEIVLVLDEDSLEQGSRLVRERAYRRVSRVCAGGPRRQDSVRCGLESLTPCDWVIVHDGARPCLDQRMLRRGMRAAQESGASAAGVPVKDTIKVVSPRRLVVDTPSRARLWASQTPQVFCYDLLCEAHQFCAQTVTDDAALVESMGHPVRMFLGSYENLKVTTPEDLAVAEAFLRARTGVPR